MIEGLQAIDPEYEERMLAFEIDCDKGKGDAWACHSVGEFLAVVKVRLERRGGEDVTYGPIKKMAMLYRDVMVLCQCEAALTSFPPAFPHHQPRKTTHRVTTTKPPRCTRTTAPSTAIPPRASILAGSFWVGEASHKATPGP